MLFVCDHNDVHHNLHDRDFLYAHNYGVHALCGEIPLAHNGIVHILHDGSHLVHCDDIHEQSYHNLSFFHDRVQQHDGCNVFDEYPLCKQVLWEEVCTFLHSLQ